ncbi:MAG: hypothetical protein OXC93_09935 [Rhodospirillaceae bacterium]|nr:hypothetical protein [Rhodospirillaceae bacterium]
MTGTDMVKDSLQLHDTHPALLQVLDMADHRALGLSRAPATPSVFWITRLEGSDRSKRIGPIVEKADPIFTFHGAQSVCTFIIKSA